MAFDSGTPWALPGGQMLWFGNSVPTAAGDGTFQAGDILWRTDTAGGAGVLYRCITGGSPGTWQCVARGESASSSKNAAYTATINDDFIVLTANANITLPAAATPGFTGHRITVTRVGAANGAVVSDHINAGTTATFGSDGASVTLVDDGTTWRVVGTYGTVVLS